MKKEDLIASDSFCAMPWYHLATEPNGSCKMCCLNNKRAKKDGVEYNLGYNDIKEIYNSKYFVEARKRMLQGERIESCSHCWTQEDNGGVSQRQTINKIALNEYPEILEYIERGKENDFKVDHDPQYYDFRFGNLCNLKCRSCGPLNSSQLAKEFKQLEDKNPSWFYVDPALDNINDWYQTETFKKNVYTNIEKVKKIYFTGGEPTLVEENYHLMRKLIEIGVAKNVNLQFNTNMTNLKDEFYELIQQFKTVEIAISIEGYKDIQEYLRYPSKWSQIEKNIKRMASMPKNIIMFAVPVVQSVNLEYITDFFQFVDEINSQYGYYRIKMLPILLDAPKMLSLHILPKEYKQECMQKIDEYIEDHPYYINDEHFMGRYNNIKAACEIESYDPAQLKKFKEYTDVLDKNRNQNLSAVNIKLWEIVNNV